MTRQQVLAEYQGHPRVFCAHVLGWCQDSARCLGYQFAGSSRSGRIVPGSPNNWRCFKVDELRNVRLRPGPWHGGPSHERPQRCVDIVDVDVERPEMFCRPAIFAYGGQIHASLLTATLTRKGQVTIPKVLREVLQVHAGDRLDFVVEGDGRLVVRVRTTNDRR